ncbi:MAG: protein kinase [Phycisphaeraceae bacterium]|nr:protein kinase [Phycisphaeraceae bacterium]
MLKPGSQIGPYTIERELGRGGMGVVFLARDTHLDRAVAIKALPEHLSSDSDRLARFQREAKMLASLNHPNIGSIYGLEVSESHRFLVLEFIEGETLADRLKSGPIAFDDAIPIAKQIAEALEAAHEKGVIHRDLKPGNVMVTPDGKVKVLDFGLARTADGNPSTSGFVSIRGDSPTVVTPKPAHSPTIAGVVLGTAGYMSPEQARGKPVDKRSDIFSFGCVLFEMLSGAGPFPGENATDSMGAILHGEPPWALLPPETPPTLLLLLKRCLAKDKHNRLHDIGDARIELDLAAHDPTGTTLALAPRRPAPTRSVLPAAAILILLAGAAGWFAATRLFAAKTPSAEPTLAFTIPSSTSSYRSAGNAVISPDGRRIAFLATPADGSQRRIYLRSLDSFDALEVPETVDGISPFWSPDSRFLGFFQDGKIWAVEAGGSSARRVITATPFMVSACWAPDGTIIFAPGESGLRRVSAAGGKSEPLTTSKPELFEKSHLWPTMLPDGRRFFFVSCTFNPNEDVQVRKLFVGSLDSPEIKPVMNQNAPAWMIASGTLVYSENGTIKALPIDPSTLQPRGEAETLADGVSTFAGFSWADMSVANGGTIVFSPPAIGDQLVWFDQSGKRQGIFAQDTNIDSFRISPDGSKLAAAVRDPRSSLSDLWIYGIDRNTRTRLTSLPGWEGSPIWSNDGSRIFFSSDKKGYPAIYAINSDGSGSIDEIYAPAEGGVWYASGVSTDGKSLLMYGFPPGMLPGDIFFLPLDGSSKPKPFRATPASESQSRLSPDGKWVAYCSDEAGPVHVFIAPADGSGQRVQVSEERGYDPIWAPSGDRLYFGAGRAGRTAVAGLMPERIMSVDLSKPELFKTPPPPQVVLETTESINNYAVAPDGKRLLLQLSKPGNPDLRVLRNWVAPSAKK